MRKIKLFVVLPIFLLLNLASGHTSAAVQPGSQKLGNPDFEQGTMNGWTGQGNGQWGVESCCGQHETPTWGTGLNPYPEWPQVFTRNTWDGFVSPVANGSTQLYQWFQVTQGQKYRLSSWMFTSGATAYLERWAPSLGSLVQCASTADTAHAPFSCEFTANAAESMAFILEQGYVTGQWAVSDDWTLTPIVTVPRSGSIDTWSTLPVPYYTDNTAYVTRTDVAAWSWNNAMGKQMLLRTGDANQSDSIRIYGYSDAGTGTVASMTPRKDGAGVKYMYQNKYWMDKWHSNSYRYGFEAREGVIAHEFGHGFGLDHVGNECQLMNPIATVQTWNCTAFKPTSGDVDGMRAIYP